jgi:hypothetical protein
MGADFVSLGPIMYLLRNKPSVSDMLLSPNRDRRLGRTLVSYIRFAGPWRDQALLSPMLLDPVSMRPPVELSGLGQVMVFWDDIRERPVDFVPGLAVFDAMRRPTTSAVDKKRLLWLRLDVDVSCRCGCCEPPGLDGEVMLVVEFCHWNCRTLAGDNDRCYALAAN